jgi:hypothetical protein
MKRPVCWWLLLLVTIVGWLNPVLLNRDSDWVNPSTVFAQEKSNTYYAAQFQGPDKFTKIANAQNACAQPSGFNMNCVIVIDAILGGWPVGTSINPCSNCIWMDYTAPGGLIIVQGSGVSSGLQLQSTTGTNNGQTALGNLLVSGFIGIQTGATPAIGSVLGPFATLTLGNGTHRTNTFSAGSATADRFIALPDGNSNTVMVASLTTTAATTDNVAIQGMVSTGHCTLTPTNAAAAAGIASVFVSAKNANQITVTHTATSGWTFDIACTSA